MHADVVSSTALVQLNETLAHQRIGDAFRTFSKTITRYNGIAHEIRGDALVAEFARASDAISASLAFQAANATYNEELPDEIRPVVRVGIAMGEVVVANNTMTGEGVVLAQRLEQLAQPGCVVIQGAAHETVPKRLPFSYRSLGECELKGFDEAVRAYTVELKPGADVPQAEEEADRAVAAPNVRDKPSIAVLPLTNMSDDPEQEYFTDGLTEDIITGLSRFRSINVIARNSTFTYKQKAIKIRDVGKELGAEYIVEGSVRRAGNRVRVTVQLIDAREEGHIWAQKYDRMLDDIFIVQDEITQSILTALPEHVEAADLEKGKRKSTAQMAAYDYFLRGRELHHKFTKDDCREGIKCLEKAVELDPNFAQSWAWLGCIVGQAWVRGYLPNPESLWQKCVDTSRRALELDDEDSECHRLMSEIYLIQNKFEQAEHHNKRGLGLNPNNPRLVVQRGYLLAYTGRAEEGIEWINKVIQLDPVHPEAYYANLAIALHAARRYEDSIKIFKRVPSLQSKHHAYLVSSHIRLSQESLAQEHAKMLLELEPEFSVSRFGRSLHYNNSEEAEHFLADLHKGNLPK